jgi:hypothetical protein
MERESSLFVYYDRGILAVLVVLPNISWHPRTGAAELRQVAATARTDACLRSKNICKHLSKFTLTEGGAFFVATFVGASPYADLCSIQSSIGTCCT